MQLQNYLVFHAKMCTFLYVQEDRAACETQKIKQGQKSFGITKDVWIRK